MPDEGEIRARQPRPFESLEWRQLFESVGLDSDEKIDRLNRILVVHLIVDRLLTLLVAAKLGACAEGARPDVQKLVVDLAPLPIPKRIEIAQGLGLVEATVVEKVLHVNVVRNRLVHFKPRQGRSGWDVALVEEIASQEAADRCLRKGIEVVQVLFMALNLPVPDTEKGGEADGSTR